MAEIIPFPLMRRRRFIRKQAERLADVSPRTGEKHLAHALKVQRETMLRRGIAPDIAEAELRSAEAAIRCELTRLILSPGGAA